VAKILLSVFVPSWQRISTPLSENVEIKTTSGTSRPQHSILNAASLWTELASGQKQQLQKLLFPSGVTFVDGIYKTTETCLIFKLLNETAAIKTNLANLPGIESCFAIFDNHRESLRKPYE
jgi:hypothetical protein